MKKILFGLVSAGLSIASSVALAQAPGAAGTSRAASATAIAHAQAQSQNGARHTNHAYLGVQVSPVHPAMSANLHEHLANEQGLIVEAVADNSAASQAGLQENDVLITFDDQKLFSAEQLSKLVQADKPGRKVSLDLLRNGKREKVSVTLGERENTESEWSRNQRAHHQNMQDTQGERRDSGKPSQEGAETETFDSLLLRKLADNKLHVEVSYLDKDNKVRRHTFEGTRDAIHKDIENEKDMKPMEKAQLLQSLSAGGGGQHSMWPHWMTGEWFD